MKARSLNIGKKFVAAFAAAAVSLSLLGAGALVAPKAAFADESDSGISLQADGGATNGQIGVNTTRLPIQVEAGTTVNIAQYFSASATGGPWHIDYKITGGEKYASVNKHSGMLTGLAATPDGTLVTVTAYVESGAAPTGVQSNPCYAPALAKASLTVQVLPTTTYGYQGTDNAVMMITPKVTSYTGSIADGYTNITEDVDNQGGYYYFTYQTIAGFRNYDTPEKYADYNQGNISVTSAKGETFTLNSTNTGAVTISNVDVAKQQITVKVNAETIGDSGSLVLHKALKANNKDRILGTDVTFEFFAA